MMRPESRRGEAAKPAYSKADSAPAAGERS